MRTLPGGGVEPAEDPFDTVLREKTGLAMHNRCGDGYAGQHVTGDRFRKPSPAACVAPVTDSCGGRRGG